MSDAPRERLLTAPLLAFMLAVAAVVGWSVATRHPSPDLEGAIELLADGDLDGKERQRMLRHTMDLAIKAESLRHRWAGLLAALALQDADGFAELEARLGDGAARVLIEADRTWVGLGDPLLGNALMAMSAEAGGQRDQARTKWRQVKTQAQLMANTFARQQAAAALQRLQ